jgi:hypothetical protein
MKVRVEIEIDIPSFLIEATGDDLIEQVVGEHVVRVCDLGDLKAAMKILAEKAVTEDKGLSVSGSDAGVNVRQHWATVMSEAKTRVIVLD